MRWHPLKLFSSLALSPRGGSESPLRSHFFIYVPSPSMISRLSISNPHGDVTDEPRTQRSGIVFVLPKGCWHRRGRHIEELHSEYARSHPPNANEIDENSGRSYWRAICFVPRTQLATRGRESGVVLVHGSDYDGHRHPCGISKWWRSCVEYCNLVNKENPPIVDLDTSRVARSGLGCGLRLESAVWGWWRYPLALHR